MQLDVELQDMFSYSSLLFLIPFLIVAVVVLVCVLMKFKKRMANAKPEEPVRNIHKLRAKYDKLLEALMRKAEEGKADNRAASQELSSIIRDFVYNATGVNVTSATLEEIGELNMPKLYELVAECYVPEFSVIAEGEVLPTIEKARKVIAEWN